MSLLRLPALALLLCVLQTLPAAAGPPPGEDQAEAAYQKARRAYYRFRDDAEQRKKRHRWKRVAGQFEGVAQAFPASARAPDALFTAGRIYLDLYKISRVREDQEAAVALFTKLVEKHPRSRLADDGQMNLSMHWLEVAKDRERAIASLTYLLEQFPRGDMAPRARRMLEDLGGPPADDPELVAIRSGPRPEPASPGKPEPPAEGEAPVLSDVEVDSGPDYTRITLHTGTACTYKWGLLPVDAEHKFQRLYVDLKGTGLDPQVKGLIAVRDSVVRQVRVAPFQKDVTRVVLDLKSLGDHKVFPMDSPARVVLDVSGSTDRTARELGKPATLANSVAKPGEPPPEKAVGAGGKPLADAGTEADGGEHPEALDRVIAEALVPDGGMADGGAIPVEASEDGEGEAEGGEEDPGPRPAPGEKVKKPGAIVPPGLSKPGQSLSMLAGLKVRKVVIDPGHGGRDPGAIGKAGTLEKDITLDLAKRLARLLKADKELGLKQVLLTRSADETMALEKRTALANKVGADLFISLHCNAHRNRKFRGVETFYLDLTDDRYSIRLAARENSTSEKTISDLKFILADLALKSHVDDSISLGESLQRAMVGNLKRRYRKIVDLKLKPALFYVLIGARMPSVLIETSFLSNPEEEERLKTPDYRENLAKGIHLGIRNFIQAREQALDPG